jgi:hypothetical protein
MFENDKNDRHFGMIHYLKLYKTVNTKHQKTIPPKFIVKKFIA